MDALHIIAGEARPAQRGEWLEVHEPATGGVLGRVARGDADDVAQAVDAAKRAFPAWRGTSAADRSAMLLRLAEAMERHADALAELESRDTGKPISLARSVDIPRSIANIRFFATAILHASSEAHEFDGGGVPGGARAINYISRSPRGVAGCISPWNLPLYLLTWKIAPALATGCTVVAKPSEVTPMTASMLGAIAIGAGLPGGVLNIVQGAGPEAGAAIIEHPDVPAITFTGSTAVGRWIGSRAGEMLKRVSLELGGKNATIIFADADLDGPGNAIDLAARAAFTNQGQICLCGSRILVHESIHDRVVEGLIARARALIVGDPSEPATTFGSLVSLPHLQKVERAVERARADGARVVHGGGRVARESLPPRCRGGCFFEPTILTDLPAGCAIEREEVFGPVVTVGRFRDEAEAIALANGTDYGLAAMIFTRDVARAHRVAAALDVGIAWINCWMVRDLRTPFGGAKASGIGREGGSEALRFFTEPKNVCVRL